MNLVSAASSVPGLERGIAILRMFSRDRRELTAPDITAELKLPRSTVHRLLGCLTELDLLRRSARSVYSLSPGVLSLGFEFIASQDIVTLAQPVLERLSNETDCSSHLAVRDARNVVYLARVAGRGVMSGHIGVGSVLPAHATIMGRLLLSDLEPLELKALYEGRHLEASGPQTPVTLQALQEMIDADRARGFAMSEGFFERGIGGVAAPIRDSSGRIIAAINAIRHMGEDEAKLDLSDLTRRVVASAQEISAMMGGRTPTVANVLLESL